MIKYEEYDILTLEQLKVLDKAFQIELKATKDINKTIKLIQELGKINYTIGTKMVVA